MCGSRGRLSPRIQRGVFSRFQKLVLPLRNSAQIRRNLVKTLVFLESFLFLLKCGRGASSPFPFVDASISLQFSFQWTVAITASNVIPVNSGKFSYRFIAIRIVNQWSGRIFASGIDPRRSASPKSVGSWGLRCGPVASVDLTISRNTRNIRNRKSFRHFRPPTDFKLPTNSLY